MIRTLTIFVALFFVSGCATSPSDPESTREVALKYVNADVGTTGPFSKKNPKDLEILSDADRAQASAWLGRGAVGFVVFASSRTANATPETRIVLVQAGKVVADYHTAAK